MSESPLVARVRMRSSHYVAVAGDLALRASRQAAARIAPATGATLQGDRWVEWSFCFARLAEGPGRTLDFGADIGFLALGAAQRGHEVVAFDRMPVKHDYVHPRVRIVEGDVLTHDFGPERFDQIVNCSSVEHVGLAGRYGSSQAPDGDLQAMATLRGLLEPGGRMILTIPVGRDAVFAPLHRVYGPKRLPRLLDGYEEEESQFWARRDVWHQVDRAEALATQGSESFYALGLFVLGTPA